MPHVRKVLFCAAALACAPGCVPAVKMLETRGHIPVPPRNEVPGGRIRYLIEEPGARAEAYAQMSRECEGSYEIASEADDPPSYVTSISGFGLGFGFPLLFGAQMGVGSSVPYVIKRTIDFRCVPRGEGVAKPGE
jgi:hypothetical protein